MRERDVWVGLIYVLVLMLAASAGAQQYGAWSLTVAIDRITDEDTSVLVALASEHPQNTLLTGVVIRCSVQPWHTLGVEAFFMADMYLGSSDDFSVIYRVDRREPVVGTWGTSTNRDAVFTPVSEIPTFLSSMKNGSELAFRVTAFSGDVTYIVPVHGLNDALNALGCYNGPPL